MDHLPTRNVGEEHHVATFIFEQGRGLRETYGRLIAFGKCIDKENVCFPWNSGAVVGNCSIGKPGISFFGRAHGNIHSLSLAVYEGINFCVEANLLTKLLDVFEKRIAAVTAWATYSQILLQEAPVMIRDRVYVGNARHDNLVPSTEPAKTVRNEGSDTDPRIAAQEFLVGQDGSSKVRLTQMLAVFVGIVVVDGESFHHLFAQLSCERFTIERSVSTQRTEKSHLFISYSAFFEQLDQMRRNAVDTCCSRNIVKQDADLFLALQHCLQRGKSLPVCFVLEDALVVSFHAEHTDIPSLGQIKVNRFIAAPQIML